MPSKPDTRWPRGSEWRKWDLHFHTPSSFDYKNKSVTETEIVHTLVEAEVAAVAITDHHLIDVDRITKLQQIAAGQVTIFPGIELRTDLGGSQSIHIIGLFPEDAILADLWTNLQGLLGLTPSALIQKGGDEHIYVQFYKAVDAIRSQGGLVSIHAGKKSNSIETIANEPQFKQALKKDIAREHVDLFDLGRLTDETTYRDIVFPAIGFSVPLVIGSDNHNIHEYVFTTPTWIRANPTFLGLRQILIEDKSRVYRGNEPTILKRVRENKTKYIDTVRIQKKEASTLRETWFDCDIPFNSGLVAIIGNKGSGKSALADVIGLLGHTRQSEAFSFLHSSKFRQPKNNKSQHFEASVVWASGPGLQKGLDEDVDIQAVETAKYIPQSHLEAVCNELRDSSESRFEGELKQAIFSHVPEDKRWAKKNLDELVVYRTEEGYQRIDLLRVELAALNKQIVELEGQLTSEHRNMLSSKLGEKLGELAVHNNNRPKDVQQPDKDDATVANSKELTARLDDLRIELAGLEDARDALTEEQSAVGAKTGAAQKLSREIENFRRQYDHFVEESATQADLLGLDVRQLVRLDIDITQLSKTTAELAKRELEITAKLDPSVDLSTTAAIDKLRVTIRDLQTKLDAPTQEYQNYRDLMEEWEKRGLELVGTASTPNTQKYFEAEIARLSNLPGDVERLRERRRSKSGEILQVLDSLLADYRRLYEPVQRFIDEHNLAQSGFDLDFDVHLVHKEFESRFFEYLSQRRRGSFAGAEEGREELRRLLQSTDWASTESIGKFASSIDERLHRDHRPGQDNAATTPFDQLRQGTKLQDLYDFIFSYQYLTPRYELRWQGRELAELSPGERGTVLLLFYLLVDRETIPLILDQPEENLDNQTVFNTLVPAIRDARNRRQIIVVTHNPNLAIVCDADQVIYAELKKSDGNRITYSCGAIEDPATNLSTINVLEGTRPAFENREAKYQLHDQRRGSVATRPTS